MPTEVVVEGKVDCAIIQALSPNLNVPEPKEPSGREAAIQRAALATRQVGEHRVVLLLDYNGSTAEEVDAEISTALTIKWGRSPERSGPWWRLNERSGVRLVLAGLRGDEHLTSMGINRFTSDDYLLRLILIDDSLHSFCTGEPNLAYRPENCAALKESLDAIAELLRQKRIPIQSAKRYVHFVRAILGFEASRATFAEWLIKRSPQHCVDNILGPLRHDLAEDPPM